jgi:hypothetical protein
MNVEIGTEAAQFPEKEYANGVFVAVYLTLPQKNTLQYFSFDIHTMNFFSYTLLQ